MDRPAPIQTKTGQVLPASSIADTCHYQHSPETNKPVRPAYIRRGDWLLGRMPGILQSCLPWCAAPHDEGWTADLVTYISNMLPATNTLGAPTETVNRKWPDRREDMVTERLPPAVRFGGGAEGPGRADASSGRSRIAPPAVVPEICRKFVLVIVVHTSGDPASVTAFGYLSHLHGVDRKSVV